MTHPPYLSPGYRSTVLRAPSQELIMPKLGPDSVELTSPVFGHQELGGWTRISPCSTAASPSASGSS